MNHDKSYDIIESLKKSLGNQWTDYDDPWIPYEPIPTALVHPEPSRVEQLPTDCPWQERAPHALGMKFRNAEKTQSKAARQVFFDGMLQERVL